LNKPSQSLRIITANVALSRALQGDFSVIFQGFRVLGADDIPLASEPAWTAVRTTCVAARRLRKNCASPWQICERLARSMG
jgi:hypothetical protein